MPTVFSLEDIFQKQVFNEETYNAKIDHRLTDFLDGRSLPSLHGKPLEIKDYIISVQGNYLLLFVDRTFIYRRSSQSFVYLLDRNSLQLRLIDAQKILHATFSPDENQIAYVLNNNMYVYTIATAFTTQVTTDGWTNHIINGNCDWVYEEEFAFTKAFEWSLDSKYICFYRFDESKVKEYNMTIYNQNYNEDRRYKYPLAGEDNAKVSLWLYSLDTKILSAIASPDDIEYFPRLMPTPLAKQPFAFLTLNRHQNELHCYLVSIVDGSVCQIYKEVDERYIDMHSHWYFSENGKILYYLSEKNGHWQLIALEIATSKESIIGSAQSEIADVLGWSPNQQFVLLSKVFPSPKERTLWLVNVNSNVEVLVGDNFGWNESVTNSPFDDLILSHSTLHTPAIISHYQWKNDGFVFDKVLIDNKETAILFDLLAKGKFSWQNFMGADGSSLCGWQLLPPDFDSQKKYPILFCNYGGPGSQMVLDRFGGFTAWHEWLAQKGFIIICVDNRGTGGRGADFKKQTYLQLGKMEIEDQIFVANSLAQLPYVDANRIGHWGWSFGGFMSALAISKGTDIFSFAISVAPVTSWRFYDSIYTERYMRTPQENEAGYDENSPLHFASAIKGKYLLIHGTADDNVHFRNSCVWVDEMIAHQIQFDSAYYPNKNHRINGDQTFLHLWTKMSNWLLTQV